MNRDTQSVLLLLVGGALVRISVDDTYLRYVKGWLQPGLIAAGVVLVVIALVSLWREHLADPAHRPATGAAGGPAPGAADAAPPAVPAADGADPGAAEVAGHDHGHGGPRVAWLLLLPVLAIFVVAPPALGSYAAARGSSEITEPGDSDFAPLPAGDPVTTTLLDYATRAIWDGGRSLDGRRVRLVGFVSPRPDGGYDLTRLVVACCAGDSRPVRVEIQDGDRGFAADTWIAVTGSYGGVVPRKGDEQVPVLRADTVEEVSAPADPYES